MSQILFVNMEFINFSDKKSKINFLPSISFCVLIKTGYKTLLARCAFNLAAIVTAHKNGYIRNVPAGARLHVV
jgi:hypothetical protein